MARTLYTTRLFGLVTEMPPGFYVTDPVPTGFIWVIRDIAATSSQGPSLEGGLQGFTVNIGLPSATSIRIYDQTRPFVQGARAYHWEGRQALGPEERIEVTVFDADWSIAITGYVLSTP